MGTETATYSHASENPLPPYCWFLKDCTKHNIHTQSAASHRRYQLILYYIKNIR